MATYSIRDLEKLSGIKAHTIRIWEKRYDLFSPNRSDTNIRTYSDEDLKKILNISILNRNGVKISHIATMAEEEIVNKVRELWSADNESLIQELISCMIALDEDRFREYFDSIIQEKGLRSCMVDVIYPLMQKIGVLWITGSINPAQEHFISNIVRQKLVYHIELIRKPADPAKKTFLLYLPENELHEIGILFYYHTILEAGFNVIYLGQCVPYADLKETIAVRKADYLFTSLINPLQKSVNAYCQKLSTDFPNVHCFVSGMQVSENLTYSAPNLTPIRKGSEFVSIMNHL